MCTNGGTLTDARLCLFLSPRLGRAVGEHLQNRSEISDSFIGEESRCLDWMGFGGGPSPASLLLPERAKKREASLGKEKFLGTEKKEAFVGFPPVNTSGRTLKANKNACKIKVKKCVGSVGQFTHVKRCTSLHEFGKIAAAKKY